MSAIRVKLKDASQNVLHPETEWSLVQGKPSIGKAIFGEEWNITDTISITGSNGLYLYGEHVYANDLRPFTVRHIMSISECEFEIFDDQDKALTMSDLIKLIPSSSSYLYLPATGYNISSKRIFYAVRIQSDGVYANFVKVTNGVLDHDTTNYGKNVTEIARCVLK